MRASNGSLIGTYLISYINIGSLGYATGGCVRSTCMATRTDVGGGFRRNYGETTWTQIIQPGLVPSLLFTNNGPGAGSQSGGVWEIDIAPSNENIWWMFFRGRALRSADKGVNWSDTGINGSTGLYMAPNGGQQRLVAKKAMIDPFNPDVVYCGSQRDGLWRYMSGTWTQLTAVPAANPLSGNDGDKIMIIAIDPTASTVGSGATLRSSNIYVSSVGNGLYRSTDGGETFALVSDAPNAGSSGITYSMEMGPTGILYVCDTVATTNNLYSYNGSAWTNYTWSSVIKRIFPDPKNASRLIGFQQTSSATPIQSSDGGTTWSLWNPTNMKAVVNEVPIVAKVAETQFRQSVAPAAACILPHPVDEKDYVFSGLGVYYLASPYTTPPTSQSLTWVEDSAGIEELVAHSATVTPNGDTLLCSHDKAIIRHPGGKDFPPDCYPPWQLTNGYAVDWAIDNPNFLVCRVAKGQDYSGYSTNGGISWTQFPTSDTPAQGGTIAISNSDQIVMVPGQNGHPRYTHDNGVTWTKCAFTGITFAAEGTSQSGFGFGATDTRRFILCADKTAPGVFYIYSYGAKDAGGTAIPGSKGLWKSTDGGVNFNLVNGGDIINPIYIGYHVVLKCVEGDLYITSGDAGDWLANDGTTSTVLRSTDGGVSWTVIPGISEAMIAFGKAPFGGTYPTMYLMGFKGGVYGLYRSFDKGATTELLEPYPSFLTPFALEGDPTRYGRVIIGLSAGWLERSYDYTMRLS